MFSSRRKGFLIWWSCRRYARDLQGKNGNRWYERSEMKAADDFVQFKMTLPKEANDITNWKVIVSEQTYKICFYPKNTLRNLDDDE